MPATAPPASDQIVLPLLTWHQTARRDLPWRRDRSPYAVWIAEVMLQQTQTATVIPYYEQWMRRFPDLAALAAASLDDVLRAWAGLGYYARPRQLYRAAQLIVARHAGQIPAARRELLALPGIGRYTAGAILSLAFGQREPVLDGNVRRVLCRLYDIAADPNTATVTKQLWTLATELVNAAPEGRPGDLNEALMELGALICTPRQPRCAACPVAAACLAHARGVEADRPLIQPTARPPHHTVVAGVIQDETGALLLIRRLPTGLLAGLWGLPGGVLLVGETMEDGIRRTIRGQIGVEVAPTALLTRIKHAYTHFRITLFAWRCQHTAGVPQPLQCAEVRWVLPDALPGLAFPATDARILQALKAAASA